MNTPTDENTLLNIINSKNKRIPEGIILKARFDEGLRGHIHIYTHNTIKFKLSESENYFINFEGKKWVGSFETKNGLSEKIQPYDRHPPMYLPTTLEKMDELLTSNNGRFLSGKRAQNIRTSLKIKNYSDEVTKYFKTENSNDELSQYLEHILPRIGVPQLEVKFIIEDIFKKLDYSKIGK